MKTILIIITTYKRPEMLLNLLKQIYKKSQKYKVQLLILNDKSDADYSEPVEYLSTHFPDCSYFEMQQHYGKPEYWKVIDFAYQRAKEIDYDYLIQLPDDISLVDHFFDKAVDLYEMIEDSRKICLNLLNDYTRKGRSFWTDVKSELIRIGRKSIWRTGWVDMCYIAGKKYLQTLDHSIHPVDYNWSAKNGKSSGVGMQISRRLVNSGSSIYQVANSLVIHGSHQSVMHPDHRRDVPLVSNHQVSQKVTAGMASIPSRIEALKEAVESILPQVDHLHVYLNDYDLVPYFLHDEKITAYLGKNELGDLGDVGKFYGLKKARGYYFTLDDDIIYPADYVQTMIDALLKNDNEIVVTLHGRIFGLPPISSYYSGFISAFSCLKTVVKDHWIQIPGTGVMAFHTGYVKPALKYFETINMADIWMGKYCQERKIPVLCLKHAGGWIEMSRKYDENLSIYSYCKNNDHYQTSIINSVKWKIFRKGSMQHT